MRDRVVCKCMCSVRVTAALHKKHRKTQAANQLLCSHTRLVSARSRHMQKIPHALWRVSTHPTTTDGALPLRLWNELFHTQPPRTKATRKTGCAFSTNTQVRGSAGQGIWRHLKQRMWSTPTDSVDSPHHRHVCVGLYRHVSLCLDHSSA